MTLQIQNYEQLTCCCCSSRERDELFACCWLTMLLTMVEEMDTGDVGNPIPAKPESASDSEATGGIVFSCCCCCRSGKSEFKPAIKEVPAAPTVRPEFAVPVKLCGIPAKSTNHKPQNFNPTIQIAATIALLLTRPNECQAERKSSRV